MTFTKKFKEAISQLPSSEKDKLILKLLKKDLDLANRLMFELVSEQTVEERREKVKKSVLFQAKKTDGTYYSAGWLTMEVRYLSGQINEHVKITKDKYGEVDLNLAMINEVLTVNESKLLVAKNNIRERKFYTAVIARAFKILILISKLHEDLWMDFEDELKRLGKLIGNNHQLMKTAISNGFDVNWLIGFKIPQNIVQIHDEIRKNGYLT